MLSVKLHSMTYIGVLAGVGSGAAGLPASQKAKQSQEGREWRVEEKGIIEKMEGGRKRDY